MVLIFLVIQHWDCSLIQLLSAPISLLKYFIFMPLTYTIDKSSDLTRIICNVLLIIDRFWYSCNLDATLTCSNLTVDLTGCRTGSTAVEPVTHLKLLHTTKSARGIHPSSKILDPNAIWHLWKSEQARFRELPPRKPPQHPKHILLHYGFSDITRHTLGFLCAVLMSHTIVTQYYYRYLKQVALENETSCLSEIYLYK